MIGPSQPRFLSTDEVMTIHETVVNEHGGSHGVRDKGLLDAALATPRQSVGGRFAHEFPFGMASAYAFHICNNHPFIDGNKRTALSAMVVFLRLNGWSFAADEQQSADVMLSVAENKIDKVGVADWLRSVCRPRPSFELRQFLGSIRYKQLADTFDSIVAARDSSELIQTSLEAGAAIPAIREAQIGALEAEQHGDHQSAAVLRQHAMLLVAFYRIAEDMGYEW